MLFDIFDTTNTVACQTDHSPITTSVNREEDIHHGLVCVDAGTTITERECPQKPLNLVGDWRILPASGWAAVNSKFESSKTQFDSAPSAKEQTASLPQDQAGEAAIASDDVNHNEIEGMMRAMMKDMKELHEEMKCFREDNH